VVVKNLENGEIDFEDLKAKVAEHKDYLSALMITYPSTYGFFDANVKEITNLIHENGGQVYMDGEYECASWIYFSRKYWQMFVTLIYIKLLPFLTVVVVLVLANLCSKTFSSFPKNPNIPTVELMELMLFLLHLMVLLWCLIFLMLTSKC
jgi:hypothetical protein